jgi:hypothetical protein
MLNNFFIESYSLSIDIIGNKQTTTILTSIQE